MKGVVMGVHNRITRDKYNRIKKMLKMPADDERVMAIFGISASSCRNIRLTEDYDAYCEKVFRYHGHPKTIATSQNPTSHTTGEEGATDSDFVTFCRKLDTTSKKQADKLEGLQLLAKVYYADIRKHLLTLVGVLIASMLCMVGLAILLLAKGW